MLVIEVDDADLRRAATVYLSTLSGRGAEGHAPRPKTHANTSRPALTGPTAPARLGRSFRVTQDAEALGATLSSGARVARF